MIKRLKVEGLGVIKRVEGLEAHLTICLYSHCCKQRQFIGSKYFQEPGCEYICGHSPQLKLSYDGAYPCPQTLLLRFRDVSSCTRDLCFTSGDHRRSWKSSQCGLRLALIYWDQSIPFREAPDLKAGGRISGDICICILFHY